MILSVKNIFLTENEKDIFVRLKEQGIETGQFAHKFQYLFQKIYNNEVGYYSFRQDNVVYRFIVLPKTISLNDKSKERAFVNYLLHYYRINNKYGYDKAKKIPNSLLSLAFESNNKTSAIHEPLELFEFHKSKAILKSIETFFQKHKNYQRVEQAYISQSVKHKLNLGRNIKEINKTKIHQSKRVDVLYSDMATVSYYALRLYMQKRLKNVDTNSDELKRYAMKISSLIVRKYMIDKSFSLSLPKLYGHKVTKVFQKRDEYKLLLANLRSLFGHEQLHNDTQNLAELRHDLYTSSFFIKPSDFYEWYVYDILKTYADTSEMKIQFVGNKDTTTTYQINQEKIDSKPDFILTNETTIVKIIIDAKWKNVNTFSDIKSSDYLKLQFDTTLLEKEGFGTVSYLIYPQMSIADRAFEITLKDKEIYHFNAFEIDMNFADMRKNSLSFKYDFKQKAKKIKEEQKKESSKQSAVRSSQNIQPKRDSVIQKLINAETTEEKEALGGLFDETLWQQNEQLTKVLNVDIILPEVQEILDKFKDIMEEESITFIKSTSTIYAHYRDEDHIAFDYSMPGSGLWKLIEVELNTSFIWQLRIMSKVCDKQSPWNKVCKRNAKIDQDLDNGRKVSLSVSDKKDKSKLQSVMLGGIKLLLEDQSTLDEFGGFFKQHGDELVFIQNNLPKIIEQVSIFRNEHAHIKAMSREIFAELWKLLFTKDDNDMNQLEMLLAFKQKMKVFINE